MPKRPTKQITLIDLGKRLNLTPRAVSQALNGGKCTVRISESTKARVQALAKKLNYRPNRLAQILRMGTSGMVGILAVQSFGFLIQQYLYFARAYAEKTGLTPNIYLLPNPQESTCQRALDFILDAKVDGVIVVGDFLKKEHVLRIQQANVPAVSVGSPNVPLIPRYYANKKAGFAMLAEHLINQGAKTITLLISEILPVKKRHWHVKCAIEGTEEAVESAQKKGRNITLKFHHFYAKDFNPADAFSNEKVHPFFANGYNGMKQIIETGPLPDALMCPSDNGVHGALLACAEHGIRVPQDMMITGFENDFSSSAGLLPITSVGQPVDSMLRLAFSNLKDLIEGKQKAVNRSVALPCELIIRQSSIRS